MANHASGQISDSLLDILQAQGQQFLQSFSLPEPGKRKRKHFEKSDLPTSEFWNTDTEEEYEDWQGFSQRSSESEPEYIGNSQSGSDDGTQADFELGDDGLAAPSSSRVPDVVVFSDTGNKSTPSNLSNAAQMKAFMSSKISKLSQNTPRTKEETFQDDPEDDRTNSQNDAILHRLVHTKLLSGSLNPELELTPAHRRKALAGRVLEAAGGAKLGKGEKAIREAERNQAAKRVRLGMVERQKERGQQQLEEAKNLGNYHPTIKKLFETTSSSSAQSRKRDRGLKMGVGKFSGGLLKLSREEIGTVQNVGWGERSRGKGRGRGYCRLCKDTRALSQKRLYVIYALAQKMVKIVE